MTHRVAILMNWKNRDLRGCVQLSVLLDQAGYKTKVIPHGPQKTPLNDLRNFAPHLVVFPQIEGEDKLVKYVLKIGARIVVLHTEGTWNKDSAISFFYRSQKLYGTDNPVELDLAWGKEMQDLLVENTIFTTDEVKIVGSPRFDIYKEPLKKLIMPKEEFARKHGLDPEKPFIVWATNFVNIDRSEEELNYVEEFSEIDIRTMNRIERSLRKKNFDALLKLMQDFPKCEYIIKTHPLEVPDYYLKESEKLGIQDKITILNNETIENVLNATSIFFHTNSTASTEAWLLDIPSITLLFEEQYRQYLSFFAGGNEQATNYSTLSLLVKEYLEKNHEIPDKVLKTREEFISRWYYKVDGNSTKRAAAEIDNFIKTHKFSDISSPLNKNIIVERMKASIFFNMIRKLYFVLKGEKSYWSKIAEKDRVTEEEIQELRDEIETIYDNNNYHL